MSRPVSWKALEPGTPVYSSDGEQAARVSRLVGDANADIFTGLALLVGALGAERFVASERVTAIATDRVELSLTTEEIRGLPRYEDSPAYQVHAGGRSLLRRLRRR